MEEFSDLALMQLVQSGDIDKLAILYERYKKALFSYFYRLSGNRERSEDMVQTVFYRILKSSKQFKAKSKFTTWMFSIGHNVLVDSFKKRENKNLHDKLTDKMEFSTQTKVFVLYNIFGSVNVEGVSGNTVTYSANRQLEADDKSSLEKAKTELKVKMEKYGDTIIIYLKSPYIDTRPQKSRSNNWNHEDHYSFSFDFDVRIPKDAEIKISFETLNGDMTIKHK